LHNGSEKPVEIRCEKCGTVFEAQLGEEPLCPVCRRFGTGTAGAVETESRAPVEEKANPCAVHPGNPATETCERCGNFMCPLCIIRVGRRRVCPDCFNLLYDQDKAFVQYASFGERLGALLLDILFFFLIYLVVAMSLAAFFLRAQGGEIHALFTLIMVFGLWSFYVVGMWTFAGATLGKKAAGIKVIGPDSRSPSILRSLARYAMFWVSAAGFFLGFLWAAWEHRNRTWHDLVAGTEVIKVRRKMS
jgi:uncharacterized RDD family membrane protein YckC